MSRKPTRRDALRLIGAATGAAMIGGRTLADDAPVADAPARMGSEPSPSRHRVLRVAHLTDVHIQPERRAGEGMIAALHHVQSARELPDLILNGGDCVMDSFEAEDARAQLQWDLWKKVLGGECSLPVEHCIGNHDIWGWNKSRSKTTGNEPSYGKRRAIENLGLPERYRSFDRAGWRFIVLDSVQQPPEAGDGYRAYLDDEQFDWLDRTLQSTDPAMPVLVLSHVPIISASAVLWAERDNKKREFTISGSLVHSDAIRIKDLFAAHRNVRLCLSGHLHLVDRVDYNGVTYLCSGAVCGNWWKGKHKDCSEGYALVDLYGDGEFEHEYVAYGWKAAT